MKDTADPELNMVVNLFLGDIQRMRGNTKLAVQFLQKAVEIDPGCQAAATALSHAMFIAGNSVGSHQMVGQLLERKGKSAGGMDGWWRNLIVHADRGNNMMLQMRPGDARVGSLPRTELAVPTPFDPRQVLFFAPIKFLNLSI